MLKFEFDVAELLLPTMNEDAAAAFSTSSLSQCCRCGRAGAVACRSKIAPQAKAACRWYLMAAPQALKLNCCCYRCMLRVAEVE
jgi:hypothetical protein